MDRHPLTLEEMSLDFVAVDEERTRVREDAFFFREMPYGFDLFITSVLPPVELADTAMLDLSLRLVVEHGKNVDKHGNSVCPFRKDFMLAHCLTPDHYTPAVVVRYAVDNERGIVGTDVTAGSVRLSHILSFEEYCQLPEARRATTRLKAMLDELAVSDPILQLKIDSYLNNMDDPRHTKNIVLGTLSLFNHACCLAAKQEKVPYFRACGLGPQRRFKFYPGHATFNRPFRDPVSLINLTNLSYALKGKPALLSALELRKALPRHPERKRRVLVNA